MSHLLPITCARQRERESDGGGGGRAALRVPPLFCCPLALASRALVSHLAAGEAPDRDDHGCFAFGVRKARPRDRALNSRERRCRRGLLCAARAAQQRLRAVRRSSSRKTGLSRERSSVVWLAARLPPRHALSTPKASARFDACGALARRQERCFLAGATKHTHSMVVCGLRASGAGEPKRQHAPRVARKKPSSPRYAAHVCRPPATTATPPVRLAADQTLC